MLGKNMYQQLVVSFFIEQCWYEVELQSLHVNLSRIFHKNN